ncbi:hypothetical protein [Mycolicibacterium farcinogenes]|uniref:Uncharacterized protein n=1 Tax=Mycolicibacterium farcinogenes TaxID=1802 RepID=A0ACD1FH97_MYCFR|nr:hypothetical protein [Mycolicibacterium farcinogenes]QZH66429.1 hypothetical protein K6L26_01555 [Mycolicibacterium farcinogenes]
MDVLESNFGGEEHVTAYALDLLDELRLNVSQCLLVLGVLSNQADLSFGELQHALVCAREEAKQAFEASSVVHQGAKLDESWGTALSRPKAIFARHSAAVRGGAPRVNPLRGLSDRFERQVWQLPALDRSQDFVASRPVCQAAIRATGSRCSSAVIYVGAGTFAAHCYSHATAVEREKYRAHARAVDARQSTSHQELLDIQQRVGEVIADLWTQRRERRQKHLEELARLPAERGKPSNLA